MPDCSRKFTRKISLYIFVFFFLSGMCSLLYQIIWTRILSLLFGHTTFAISTVITSFMGGLALGSWFFGRWSERDNLTRACCANTEPPSFSLLTGLPKP